MRKLIDRIIIEKEDAGFMTKREGISRGGGGRKKGRSRPAGNTSEYLCRKKYFGGLGEGKGEGET